MSFLIVGAALALSIDPACEPAATALGAVQSHLDGGALREAEREADRAIDMAPECALAQLALVRVLQSRLEDASGLSALGLSRRYRRAVATALDLDPNNVEARSAEIGYLIHAPGMAGGDRTRAAERIESLREIDAVAGAQQSLELGRANNDVEAMVEALETLIDIAPDPSGARIELAYRLIRAQRYEDAEASLLLWPDSTAQLEAERAYYRGALRVLGGFDLEAAEPFLIQTLQADRDEDASARASRDASIWGLIGGAREGLSDLDGARDAYERALAINPENARASEGTARLGPP
jgi:tetratricopeptide (TPR) repeat protein